MEFEMDILLLIGVLYFTAQTLHCRFHCFDELCTSPLAARSTPHWVAFERLTVPLASDTTIGVQMRRLRMPVDRNRSLTHPGAYHRPVHTGWHLGTYADPFAVVAVPVHKEVLLEDCQCTGLSVIILKVEPEVQLQLLRRRCFDAAVLVLRVKEEVGGVVLGEFAVCTRLATCQILYGGEDLARP